MLVAYMDRVNLSVATPVIMDEFNFSKMEIGVLQTCFFIAYTSMQVPGGILSDFFKPRSVVAGAVTWWSAFTVLTAYCTSFNGFAVVRTLFGLGEAPILPALNAFLGRWFPDKEKGLVSAMVLAGGFIGPAIGTGLTVAIMAALGWRHVFIVYGFVGFAFVVAWHLLAKASPQESPFVNQEETAYIEEGRIEEAEKQRKIAPWGNFLKSSQFWAAGIQGCVADYIMYMFLSWLPLYLLEAQHFSLSEMGIAAIFPWLALTCCTLLSGWGGDRLVAAGHSKKVARSYLAAGGFIGCGLLLYLGAMATTPTMNVICLTLSFGFLGLAYAPAWAVGHDIGGKYVGSVVGWINFGGNMGGIFAPVVTAWIVTTFGWQAAIISTAIFAAVGVVSALLVRPDSPIKLQTLNNVTIAK
ncbi:MFS transporter [Acetonema longum]|nr:MFS transporter [Acetonema longum]